MTVQNPSNPNDPHQLKPESQVNKMLLGLNHREERKSSSISSLNGRRLRCGWKMCGVLSMNCRYLWFLRDKPLLHSNPALYLLGRNQLPVLRCSLQRGSVFRVFLIGQSSGDYSKIRITTQITPPSTHPWSHIVTVARNSIHIGWFLLEQTNP